MILSFCDNYRNVEKLNVFSGNNGIPYIEFYIPRKNIEFKICKENEISKTIEAIRSNLSEDEWLSNLNVNTGTDSVISYEITKEVMYVVPVENATHTELKHFINNLIRNNEVIDIDRIKSELNKAKSSTISEFAENIIRRI